MEKINLLIVMAVVVICLFKINYVLSIYTFDNATYVFNVFKEKYNKKYKSTQEEEKHQEIFVSNLNMIDELNANTTDRDMFFIPNQYADLNPNVIESKYAIAVKPYYTINNKEGAEFASRQREKELNTDQLFDLENAKQLYEGFKMKYHKKNYTKKRDQTIHFYRFVKTLVELNKKYSEGDTNMNLNKDADAIKEPNAYFS